jgi:uncharacterized protein (DUF433 family)
MTKQEEFTVGEASFITGQPVRRIHRLFDEGPIPRRSTRRQGAGRVLRHPDLLFVVATSEEPLSHLDQAGKDKIYRLIVKNWTDDRVEETRRIQLSETVELLWSRLRNLVEERADELARARTVVATDPEVRGAEPVIRGTRVPVQVIHDLLTQGTKEEEILEHYPGLTREMVHLAEVYACAYPRRGRPPRHAWHARSSS